MGDLDFLNDFNPEKEAVSAPSTVPPGDYVVAVTGAQLKRSKSLTGMYISLELSILEGEHAKRKVWDIINIKNDNPQAAMIGRQTLAALAMAADLPALKDSQELVGKVVKVKLAIKKESGGYEAKNQVKRYMPAACVHSSGDAGPF